MEENKKSKLVETLREPKAKETLKKLAMYDMMYAEYLKRLVISREIYIQYQKQLEERRKNEPQ